MKQFKAVVADIGGTNTRVALTSGTHVRHDTIRRFRNCENSGIEPILKQYLAELQEQPEAVCIDMAGPVHEGIGTLTNLDWRIDSTSVAETTGAKTVALLNDMQAMGHALAHIGPDSLQQLLPGLPASNTEMAVRLVVNVGTGLNMAPVYRTGGHTSVPPAEAGHVSLPAQTAQELRLLEWIAESHGTPSFEEALSGRGLEHVYAFHCKEDGAGDLLEAAQIMRAYGEGQDRAIRTLRMFTRFAGRYASDLAMITLPFGGIYLVGGVMSHVGPHLLDLGFAEAFADKGRFSEFMAQFPVHLMTDDYAPLAGCAGHLSEKMGLDG
ncbi:ROK family protein [Pelagimonas varians]|uniref:Glucokinase n=1 Tax=Pelagimonas varians TaxID=696760 RepID=A0A238KYJ6_9RHOB|nr:ROK family protein [Pelagimonas varians]PYG27598.1 glucokinase [Pelagimonas varians]SMX47893.1 Glucokinase [Pelagimonas varians]